MVRDDNGDNDWKKITEVIDDGDWKVRLLSKDVGLDVTCPKILSLLSR
jgi:hypothetical protein